MIDEAPATLTSVVDLSRSMCGRQLHWMTHEWYRRWVTSKRPTPSPHRNKMQKTLPFLSPYHFQQQNQMCYPCIFIIIIIHQPLSSFPNLFYAVRPPAICSSLQQPEASIFGHIIIFTGWGQFKSRTYPFVSFTVSQKVGPLSLGLAFAKTREMFFFYSLLQSVL